MDTAIITALISAVVTLVGCIINNSAQQRKNDIEQDKRMTEITHANELNLQQIEASISQKIALLNEKFDELTRDNAQPKRKSFFEKLKKNFEK